MKERQLIEQMETLSDSIDNFKSFITTRELVSSEIIEMLKQVAMVSAEMNVRDLQFVETHNKIVNSLSDAEREHWKTLQSFLEQLHKRSDKIIELNEVVSSFNDAMEKTERHANHISETLKTLNTSLVAGMRNLENWEDYSKKQVSIVAKKSFGKFLSSAKWILVLNFLFTLGCLVAVFYK